METLAKTFKTEAITGKGTFPVQVKVWKEGLVWKSEANVEINGVYFNADFNRYDSTKISSFEVGKHFGLNKRVMLKCDCSEVKKYITSIEMEISEKSANDQMEINILNELHNY